ncbi:hypothetical protein F0562_011640 [Nyssa sinensis]|uniref:Uncharacterized protein n=1 Tax=Nyssa sinensis TaxID=561372 RepID=A0A5J4ZV16_9ASTE|nr:hypothetical protein F0562_011640 [Nyssa sinensis]
MGNCSHKAVTDAKAPNSIRIVTDSGGILELEGPKLVGEVLSDFPGYGIFGQRRLSSPLFDHQQLVSNQFYYLLPLGEEMSTRGAEDHAAAKVTEPMRMSSSPALDLVTNVSTLEVLPQQRKGVWRVKLVMETKQLEEILSEQKNTEALIEKMRMAASSANVTPKRVKSSRAVKLETSQLSVLLELGLSVFAVDWAPCASVDTTLLVQLKE